MSLQLSSPPCTSLHLSLRRRSHHRASFSLSPVPAVVKKRKRCRKLYPGESSGIAEEMRLMAVRLRAGMFEDEVDEKKEVPGVSSEVVVEPKWEPSMEGFLKYLVHSLLVFSTIERIIEESDNVDYSNFQNTGLERTERLVLDLEWLRQHGYDILKPGTPGTIYVKYLEDISEASVPSFLCHFCCIYFAHITGGQVISKKVSEEFLGGKEFLFNQWDGNPEDLLRSVRDKLNKLGERLSRDVKNKCLSEAARSFRMSEQILRLIIS